MKRREMLRLSLGGLLLGPLSLRALAAPTSPAVSPDKALEMLKEGNRRYVEGLKTGGSGRNAQRRDQVAESQSPYAIILGCADSRVAPEVLFDAGIGDLFVVRVAGNIVSPANYGIMGSLEFGVKVLGAGLIVVLGHSACGAVDAAIKTIDGNDELPGSVEGIVDAIRPAARNSKGSSGDALANATVANVKMGMQRLPKTSEILKSAIDQGRLKVAGGVYDLRSGEVTFV